MKEYLKNISSRLKNYSQSLDKKSILLDKPWTMIDDDMEQQKLIFRKNHELIISKNGDVQTGKWEYFSEAKSLLIDRGKDKLLCNEAYVDDSVLILHLDGTKNRFFALANENKLPDLDIYNYLKKLRYDKENIEVIELNSGAHLEVAKINSFDIYFNAKVTIEAEEIKDGQYVDKNDEKVFYVGKSKIQSVFYKEHHQNELGERYLIHKRLKGKISSGDYIYYQDKTIKEGLVDYDSDVALIVKESEVIEFKYKKQPWFLRFFKNPRKLNYFIKLKG